MVVSGENRFLSGDLNRFIFTLFDSKIQHDNSKKYARSGIYVNDFYIAKPTGISSNKKDKKEFDFAIYRNPHLSSNEESVGRIVSLETDKKEDEETDKNRPHFPSKIDNYLYLFDHLKGIIMTNLT